MTHFSISREKEKHQVVPFDEHGQSFKRRYFFEKFRFIRHASLIHEFRKKMNELAKSKVVLVSATMPHEVLEMTHKLLGFRVLPSLKQTFSHLKMDGWNTSFLLGNPIFRCYISFREGRVKKIRRTKYRSCDPSEIFDGPCRNFSVRISNMEAEDHIFENENHMNHTFILGFNMLVFP